MTDRRRARFRFTLLTRVESKNGAYGDWFKNVAEAIQKKDPSHLIVKPEEAAQVIEIIEAAGRSSREGKRISL